MMQITKTDDFNKIGKQGCQNLIYLNSKYWKINKYWKIQGSNSMFNMLLHICYYQLK